MNYLNPKTMALVVRGRAMVRMIEAAEGALGPVGDVGLNCAALFSIAHVLQIAVEITGRQLRESSAVHGPLDCRIA